MPAIRVRIPRIDRSVYRSGLALSDITAKRILSECLVDIDATRTLAAVRRDLVADGLTLWFDDAQASRLALLAERDGLADQSAAASAILHAYARAAVDPDDPAMALPEPPPPPLPAEPEVPAWRITVVVPAGRAAVLQWPILQESEKAVRIETPAGAIWLPRHVVTPRTIYGPNHVAALMREIGALSTGEELLQILAAKEAEPGRWRATVRTVVAGGTDSLRERKRQIWLSAAHVVKVGRHCFAARWTVTRALDEARAYMADAWPKSTRFAPNECLPRGKGWAGLAQLEHSITEAMERLTRI